MKLLLAVDLSEAFTPVVDEAITWAVRLGAQLDLVFVGLYDDLHQFVSDPHVRAILATESETLRREHRAQLDTMLANVPEANRGRCHVLAGPPAAAILSIEDDYDAIFIATHGRKGLSHLWLGSVAERVVRTSNKTVIVLRMPAQPA